METLKRDIFIEYLDRLHSDAKCALNYRNDYELLIAIILSAQTTDISVNKVTETLFSRYKSFFELSNAEIEDVEEIIRPIGIYKNKAKNIILTSKKMVELGYTNVPNDFNVLITLPGVGRKTSNVFLAEYYNSKTLGVDTHIMRVSKRLGIASENDDAYQVECKLKDFIKEYNYKKLHHMMISFGRNECNSRSPICDNCELKKYCNYKAK